MKALKTLCAVIAWMGLSVLYAADPGDVVINEIAWMGTDASTADEWIELYNTSDAPIDIGNWSIYGADTGVILNFADADGSTTTIIPAQGYLIYANDENSVKNNSGENIVDVWDVDIGMNNSSPGQVILYDAQDGGGNVIDIANQTTGNWFAGIASPDYKTMERLHPAISGSSADSWSTNDGATVNGQDANGDPINGTPKVENSVYDISLSVEMSRFSAAQSSCGVVLHWTTESEVNVLGFYLSRADGEGGEFTDLNTAPIPCKGNGSSREVYEYTDYTVPCEGMYTYRLDEVDAKGKRRFLALKAIRVTEAQAEPAGFHFIRSYPNPFNPNTTIEFQVHPDIEGRRISLTVYDVLGRPVRKLIQGSFRSGFSNTEWNGRDEHGVELPSGMYFAVLKVDGQLHGSRRLIKMQ